MLVTHLESAFLIFCSGVAGGRAPHVDAHQPQRDVLVQQAAIDVIRQDCISPQNVAIHTGLLHVLSAGPVISIENGGSVVSTFRCGEQLAHGVRTRRNHFGSYTTWMDLQESVDRSTIGAFSTIH